MSEEYIPPYNYCNYRCEKCPDLKNCTLASMEVVREAELVAQGKDPQDQKVIFEEVKNSFEEAMKLLHEIADKERISLEEEDLKGYSPPAIETFPLVQLAHEFTKRVFSILEESIPLVVSDENSFREQVTDLVWDANIIPAKLYRAFTGKWEAEREEDISMKEISMEDSLRSAQVALKSLNNCLNILKEISEAALDKREKVNETIVLGNNLKTALYEEFQVRE